MEISAIIPTFNEEQTITKTLDAIQRLVNVDEVVIVDGGSADATVRIIEDYELKKPLKLIKFGEANRGKQLHEGTRHASHEIFWFLHADTRPVQGCAREVKKYMNFAEVAGGNFQVIFDGGSRWARFMTWLHPKLQTSGLVYGDSAIFTRRDTYDAVGGYKPLRIFEDVDLYKRLRKKGDFMFLTKSVTTSSRRFQRSGYLLSFLKWSTFQSLYWLGFPARFLARYYRAVK